MNHIDILTKYTKCERGDTITPKIIRTTFDGIYILSHFMSPIMPNITEKIFAALNTPPVTQFSQLKWNILSPNIKFNKRFLSSSNLM